MFGEDIHLYLITIKCGSTVKILSVDNMQTLISGVAGGLTNLSKMPACNLMLLGAQRKTLSGFSSTSLLPHTGYIYHCDVVQSLPPVSINLFAFTYLLFIAFIWSFLFRISYIFLCFQDLRRKAARLVAAKCTLAARVDSFHESVDGKVSSVIMIYTTVQFRVYSLQMTINARPYLLLTTFRSTILPCLD